MFDLSRHSCAKCFIRFVIVFTLLRFGTFNIFHMYFVWKTSHCLMFWFAVISDMLPYSKRGRMNVLNRRIMVVLERPKC